MKIAGKLVNLALLVIVVGLAGCGSSRHHFVYVIGRDSEGIFAFEETSKGLTKISGSPFSTGSVPTAIAVTPSRAFAYVLSAGGNGVLTYTVNSSTGALAATAGAVATGSGPVAIAIDASSSHLYVLNQISGSISAFLIDTNTGALTALSGSPFTTVTGPVSMAMAPKGDAIYVVSPTNGIASFTINSDGTLSPGQAPLAAGMSPAFVTVDPTGKFVYVADSVGNAILGFTASGAGPASPQ